MKVNTKGCKIGMSLVCLRSREEASVARNAGRRGERYEMKLER